MKHAAIAVLAFLLTAAFLTVALVLSAKISPEAIKLQMLSSAEYLCETDEYAMAVEGVNSTRIDHYADAILLNIAWHFDGNDSLRSVLEASYYEDHGQDNPHQLLRTVEEGLPANHQYLRYWHGSIALVRPLLTFLTLPQIYLWHGILLACLVGSLLFRLLRRKAYAPAIGIAAGMILIACWLIPRSLEYTWVFLMLFVQLHLTLGKRFPKEWKSRSIFFLISGMLTSFLDFLTCETLTLLMPLLLILWLDREERQFVSSGWKTLVRIAVYWCIGYGGMFLLKWMLAGLVLGVNPLPYVTGHIEERLVGQVSSMNFFQEIIGALRRNVTYLFPVDYGVGGSLIGIALLLSAIYVGYVYHRKHFDRRLVMTCAIMGMIPYVRYVVLANHSYLHAFFTYRAQLTTVFALSLILAELTGWGRRKNGNG